MKDWNWKNIVAPVAGVVILGTAVVGFYFPDGILNGTDGKTSQNDIPCFQANAEMETALPGIGDILGQANRNRGDDCD